ncbi:hypothetical protein KUTeg_013304 [Tegillarca granosa]|uniref:Protein kintoun n=1 Tax=Tegillarca granosa TaxID=220873 RepID=A0ABQ9EYF9_TEGGR|nr:hypothetical protein KUTeg_013304 [Tegillarca granosa]
MASTGKDTFEKLDITEEEIKNITKALKDEKFRKMFVEYAEEISNPENRKLYEQEIAQLENERGMNVQFIHPKPGHVLKTSVDGEKKAFINICQNDKVGKPTSEKQVGPNGVRGLNWSIPHSQTPPREDLDKGGKTCMVYDVVFHPDTYRMGESNARFKKMIEDTALDGVEKQFGVKLDRKNVKHPKMTYKGIPVASIIRTKADDNEAEKKTFDENDPLSKLPYPYDNKTSEEKAKQMAEEVKRKEEQKKKVAEKTTIKNPKKNTINEPKYTIIHRSNMDIQEYRNAPDARLNSTRPKELVVKVELPLLSSVAQVDLDIFEQKLLLESSKPAAYKLDLNLPYPVDDDQGSAKFDKSKRCLIITLPVLPDENVKIPSFIDEASDSTNQDTDTPSNNQNNNNMSPLIQELPDNDRKEPNLHPVPMEKKEPVVAFNPKVSYSLPEFTYNQDDETISYILHVKNVNFDSVSKSFPSPNVCDVKFVTIGSGGFPVHYRITFKFEDGCYIVGEHCSIDVNDTNVAVVLLKDPSCRGTWNKFQAGFDENMKLMIQY